MNEITKQELVRLNTIQEETKTLTKLIGEYSVFCYDNKINSDTYMLLLSNIDRIDLVLENRKSEIETENGK